MTRATDVAVLVTVVFGFSLNAQSRPQLTPRTLAQFSASIEDLARASGPAVVQISVRGRAPIEEGGVQGAGFTAEQRTTGSGVIVDPDGYIVTNAHVVNIRVFAKTGASAEGLSASFPRTSLPPWRQRLGWIAIRVSSCRTSCPTAPPKPPAWNPATLSSL